MTSLPAVVGAIPYRPGLDGLRAAAVGAVLVYHLSARWLPGGFLGVDVFFALSGFLITALLVTGATRDGRIDLVTFWIRRVRRLLPAALLMVAAVAVVAAFTLPRYRLGSLRADGFAAVSQLANWRFIASGQSYVDTFAPPSPLRHVWSLAVEEQFYLIWPMLVAVVLRWSRRRTRWLLALTVGLALGSAALMRHLYSAIDPSRSYYGTDTRANALLAGAAVALVLLGPGRRVLANWLRWCAPPAALALLAALALMHDSWHWYYRGVGFALALVAAALVGAVAVVPDGLVGRLFAVPPLPWFGRLSYGIYLWHWPVYCWLDEASVFTTGALAGVPASAVGAKLGLTMALATASYYLVERPLRRGWGGRSARLAGRPLLAPVAAAGVLGVLAVATMRATTPVDVDGSQPKAQPRLLAAASTAEAPRLATAGDSVAKSLAPGLIKVASARGWGYVDGAVSSCSVAALLLVEADGRPWATGTRCPDVVPAMQRNLVGRYDPSLILVHSRWEVYPLRRPDGVVMRPGTAEHLRYVRAQLRAALRRLTAGRAHVVVIEPIPMADSLCRRLGHPLSVCRGQVQDPEAARYNALRRATAAEFHGRATVLSVPDLLCPGDECTDEVAGRTPRPDGLHFSPEGAAWAAPEIVRRVVNSGALG